MITKKKHFEAHTKNMESLMIFQVISWAFSFYGIYSINLSKTEWVRAFK